MSTGNRPISPFVHYLPQFPALVSFTHRITGMALGAGALLLAYWLNAAAYGAEAFARAQAILGSWFGLLVLFGMTFAMFYHLCNGIRHMFWDAGYGYAIGRLQATAVLVIVVSLALTVIAWWIGFAAAGGSM